MKALRKIKFLKTESRMVVAQGQGRGNGEMLLNGDRVSVSQDEKVLEISYTTMSVYLPLLRCTLRHA